MAYVKYCGGPRKIDEGFGRAANAAAESEKTCPQPPSRAGITVIAAMTVT